jgi:hypothetical protein
VFQVREIIFRGSASRQAEAACGSRLLTGFCAIIGDARANAGHGWVST